jgi:hypothetical protein
MNMLVRSAAAIAVVPAIAQERPALAEATNADPIFAAIEAHRNAHAETIKACDGLAGAERQLQAEGCLSPSVVSRGNEYSGFPPPRSISHAEIDLYSPADLFPDDNKREHAELEAAIRRHDELLAPHEEPMDAALDLENDALWELVSTVPTTMKGVLALLAYEDQLWEMSPGPEHLHAICYSIEEALETLVS